MRGVYTSTYLGELADAFARKRRVPALDVGQGFDLIVGTSTGGIVACALAAGVPLRDVVSLYQEHGRAIFPMKLPTRLGPALITQLFTRPAALASGAKALRDVPEARFGSETLEEVYTRRGIALAIPAVEMNRHHSWVFKTPHHPNTNGRDNRYRLADVCLATTAAPLFRSLAPLDDPHGGRSYFVFADGGLWANNPVIVGLVEALELAAPEQPIEVLRSGRARALPVNTARMGRLARCATRRLGIRAGGELVIVFISAHMMRTLNRRFRRHDWTTDVLSFRYDNNAPEPKAQSPERIVGEIFIAPSCARAYAARHGIPYVNELSRYVIHGLLHWLGREDRTLAQQTAMRRLEDRLLTRWTSKTRSTASTAVPSR
jgi:rRNA maturation RNase YbeY